MELDYKRWLQQGQMSGTNPTIGNSIDFFNQTLQSNTKDWMNNIGSTATAGLSTVPSVDLSSLPNIKDSNNFQNVIDKVKGTSKSGDWFRKLQGGLQKNLGVKLPTSVTGIGNLAVGAANLGLEAFGAKKAEVTNGFSNVLSIVNSLPLGAIPGVGSALKLGLGAVKVLDDYTGQTTKKQGTDSDLDVTGREFNYNTLANKKLSGSDRVKGWFGDNTYKRSNRISNYYDGQNLKSAGSSYLNSQNLTASNNTTSTVFQKNNQLLLGSLDNPYGNRMLAAKHGTKIEYLQGGNKISNLINSLIGKDEKVKLSDVKHGDDAECKDCAKWQNDKLRNEGYATYGDAWRLGKVKEIYNGYDPAKRPSNYNVDSVRAYNKDAANRFLKEFDSRDLDTTKVYIANMFYNGSDYQERAFNEGKGVAGTHTGAVHWNSSDGTRKGYWKNSHNISGKVHVEPFVQTQGGNRKWGVTAIYEPKEKDMLYKAKESFKDNVQTIKRVANKVKTLKSGGKIDNTSNDKVNVIPEGAFHSRKNNLPEDIAKEVTSKGIPVITKDGDEITQHAEIERNEIIFHKELTNKLEELLKQYNSETNQKKKDEIAIKAGKLLKKEILYNTKDNTGLLEELK